MARASTTASVAKPYHHGNLADALVREGLQLAAEGGPETLSLREVARRAGVSATAAYRHFTNRDDLVMAVKVGVLARLGAALRAATRSRLPSGLTDAERARRRLIGIGQAYVEFAVTNPGQYRVIFAEATFPSGRLGAERDDFAPESPYGILSEVLDQMADAGALTPERRRDAELPMWALVHGLSSLILEGPYGQRPRREQRELVQSSLELVISGLQGHA
jgi:AcrR family transcriptional regulator